MLESRPAKSAAIVVGVDHYGYGERWQLAGPGSDALKCVDWLLARGLKATNIALFLSDQSWKSDAEVAAWVAKNKWKKPRRALRDEIVRFVDKELDALKAEALFVYWGGHGVVDDRTHRNYLFTEDAAVDTPYCVCTQDLMGALQGPRFRHLSEQVAVFDACANPFADSGESALPAAAAFAAPGAVDRDIKQCLLFASAAGKRAANVSERRTGLFSQAYFAEIARLDAAGDEAGAKRWPDFLEAFEGTLGGIEALQLDKQQPFVELAWPGRQLRRSGEPPGVSARVSSLLALVQKTEALPGLLYRLYLRSLADSTRAVERDAGIERWLRDLDDLRPRDAAQPPPLVEFAERLARELRRGNNEGHEELSQWVIEQTRARVNARAALMAALDAEEKAARPRATLFIELDAQQHNRLHWWIHTPDPQHRSARVAVQAEDAPGKDLAAQLCAITAQAEQKVGHRYVLAVGFIVPDTLLASRIESTAVAFEDDGLQGEPTPLNQRYPVTLHWDRRVRARPEVGGKPVNAWRQALDTLGPRFKAGGGADVVWLDPAAPGGAKPVAAAAMKLLAAKGTAVCLGLGHPPATDANTPDDIIGCLREGVPCFFWLARAPEGETDARKALCEAFAALKASEAPVELFERLVRAANEADPVSTVRLVWDEPGHLPPTDIFEAPPAGETA